MTAGWASAGWANEDEAVDEMPRARGASWDARGRARRAEVERIILVETLPGVRVV